MRTFCFLGLAVGVALGACSSSSSPPHEGALDAGGDASHPTLDAAPPNDVSDGGNAPDADAGSSFDAGALVEFAIPTANAEPTGLTWGPDGNLWFTETAAPEKIGTMTEAGVFSSSSSRPRTAPPMRSSPAPTATCGSRSTPRTKSAASPPEGRSPSFRFRPRAQARSESAPGRTATSGSPSSTETRSVGSRAPGSSPSSRFRRRARGHDRITLGPDGNLWFSEKTAGAIGRVTAAGVVSELAIPTAAAGPLGIVAGANGSLFFAENYVSKIGSVTPAGVFTELDVPTSAAFPAELALAANGSVWFTESSGGKLAALTDAGAFREIRSNSVCGARSDLDRPRRSDLVSRVVRRPDRQVRPTLARFPLA